MGVSVHFQDKEVHDGLICRQDAEIRLLEIMKKCITSKIKCDRDYATALSTVAYQGQKFDRLDDIKNSNVLRAWKIMMEELDNLGKFYKSNADIMEKDMLEKISNICSEKRKAKKHYQDDYNRLCQDFYNLSEEVARKRSDYCKHLELYRLMRSRFEEHYVKSGRGGRKLEEVREKYQRACRKLHLVHNEYVLLIADAQESQKDFNSVLLPCLLQQQQKILQDFIVTWQNALRDLVSCWHVSSTHISNYCESIKNAVDFIKPLEEYKSIPEKQNGVLSSSTDGSDFVFDVTLVEDTTGRLQPDQLAVDNLTVEWVRNKMSDLEATLKEYQSNMSANDSVRHNGQDPNNGNHLSLHELRSKERKLNRQIEVIRNALSEIGCEELPLGCDIVSLENSFEHGEDAPPLNRISLKRSSLTALVQNNTTSSPPSSIVDMLWKPFRRKSAPNSPVLSSRATPSNDSVFEQQSSGVCVNNNNNTHHQQSTPTTNSNTTHNNISYSGSISSNCSGSISTSNNSNSNSNSPNADCDGSSAAMMTMRTVIVSIESPSPSLTQVSNVNSKHSTISSFADLLCATNTCQTTTLGSSTRSLIDEEWFHGVLPREEVVRLLTKEGDFLVRETTRNDETQTVLSVCWGGHKHFIVQTTSEGEYRFEGPAFPTIQELITYQFQSGLPVTGRSGAILKHPILRERWELNNDDVYLIQKVGRGNFGDVYKARLKTTNQEVAVKTCRVTVPEEHKKKFLQEGRILKQYDHPNVVKLIGICVQKQPIMIVMELVPGGSLLTFLRNNKSILTQIQMLFMCRDAAAGMKYLESKNCIHRDLAARNCLVGKNNIVKISDFGMSREEEEYIVSDGMKQIPIKWTAPEALNFGKYTSLCDVWSYGVLAWEIFSKGGTPYSGLSNSKAREKIDSGYRMPAPEGTPDEMYRLMLKCWEYQPENRPHFDQIYNTMDAIINTFA